MNEITELDPFEEEPQRSPNRGYIIAAVVLLAVIAVTTVLLITQGLPALFGEKEPTATAETAAVATQVPTFTPGPTDTPAPSPPPSFVKSDTDTPIFDYESAGARPGKEWTGFFGQVLDADGNPVAGVPVIVWDEKDQPFSSPTLTNSDGAYEIRLADAPQAGTWSIQLLTEDGNPASKPFDFVTDTNTETGIQQIQVLWRQIP